MSKLGVNIDHIATVRQARRTFEPDPVKAVHLCEIAGADSIVSHLREDRRHINDRDIILIKEIVNIRFNLEMSIAAEIVDIALKLGPDQVSLVPEKREEVTTEGGLDVVFKKNELKEIIQRFKDKDIIVNLFIDPEISQIDASLEVNSDAIELHTGNYANATNQSDMENEFKKIVNATNYARKHGLIVHAGHGLTYFNAKKIAGIKEIEELNIGHSIISRAVFVGLERAVKDMISIIKGDAK
ncbi:pyridoxine 5'-phosphate synthase [bacterium]|nr:pyridoxine 5'-phosphate synthase [bacterium]